MENNSRSPGTIENPFIKPQNRKWSISLPASVNAPISPPRPRKKRRLGSSSDNFAETRATEPRGATNTNTPESSLYEAPSLAAIEAGRVEIKNHLKFISNALTNVTRAPQPGVPRLAHDEWIDLYKRSQHPHGRHFVVHQHDHPVAGPHYDLRLQISESSSISFAIMYGLPGNPNSRKLNRNATETRVHTLWSHLAEAGSASTGSMVIWDTGEYSILPYYEKTDPVETEHSHSDISDEAQHGSEILSESEKLRVAFQQRKIRLRLHGTRLPPGYTVTLRLSSANDRSAQPSRPARKRRRKKQTRSPCPGTSDEDNHLGSPLTITGIVQSTATPTSGPDTPAELGGHSDDEGDEAIRRTNAYPGAVNTVSSVHQRRWFLSLDRENSGFEKESYRDGGTKKHRWIRRKVDEGIGKGEVTLLGFEPFCVRGPEVERSVVTGRLGSDVLEDEGVTGFVRRKGWRPVVA